MADLESIVKKLKNLTKDEILTVRRDEKGYEVSLESERHLPYVDLKFVPSAKTYGILHVSSETRGFFSGGYRGQFVFETDVKDFVMHLTGSENGTEEGEIAGSYLSHPRPKDILEQMETLVPDTTHNRQGSFRRFHDAHPELMEGDLVRVARVTPIRYRMLGIYRNGRPCVSGERSISCTD